MSSIQMPWLLTMQMSWLQTQQMPWLQTIRRLLSLGMGMRMGIVMGMRMGTGMGMGTGTLSFRGCTTLLQCRHSGRCYWPQDRSEPLGRLAGLGCWVGKVGRLGWLGPGSDFGSKKLSLICVLPVKMQMSSKRLQSERGEVDFDLCFISKSPRTDGRTNGTN